MSARRNWRALGRLAIRSAGILAAVAFVALLVYGIIARSPDTTIDDALARADSPPAPGFELDALQEGDPGPLRAAWGRAAGDGTVDLAELRGTPVVLNYWASWCVPCRDEAPLLQRAWLRSRSAGVLFLGLDMQDATEDARVFIREFGLSFPHVRDGTNRTARRWGVTGIPETFFISRQGRIVAHVIGALDEAQLAAGIAAARTGRPRTAAQGGDRRPTR